LTLGDTPQYTFTNIPPHWSALIDFPILYLGTHTTDDWLQIVVDGNVQENLNALYFDRTSWASPPYSSTICDSNVFGVPEVSYLGWANVNFTHNASNLALQLTNNYSEADEYYICYNFRDFYLYIDVCDDSCSACSGPAAN
jgi:proprotein convertase subtilisin/kexin type 5